VALSRLIPPKAAMRFLLTGTPCTAAESQSFGLLTGIAATLGELEELVSQTAESIAQRPKSVIAGGKRTFYQQLEMDIVSAYALASDEMAANAITPEAEEGISSFFARKRKA
jgi:enoyl-CoA hydratase/carnithine racemase